jgi:hypothetical protein
MSSNVASNIGEHCKTESRARTRPAVAILYLVASSDDGEIASKKRMFLLLMVASVLKIA